MCSPKLLASSSSGEIICTTQTVDGICMGFHGGMLHLYSLSPSRMKWPHASFPSFCIPFLHCLNKHWQILLQFLDCIIFQDIWLAPTSSKKVYLYCISISSSFLRISKDWWTSLSSELSPSWKDISISCIFRIQALKSSNALLSLTCTLLIAFQA